MTDEPPGPNWNLEDDYETVTLTFPTSPPIVYKMKLPIVEDIVANLGDMRGHMKPEVAKTWALGQKVTAIADPAWATEPEMMEGNSILHIRDPRFGWLHYYIPRDEARKLALRN